MGVIKKIKKNGFTIMELLVVMVIMAVVFGFSIASWKRGIRSDALKTAKRQLMDDLRLMQTYALTGKQVNVCSNNPNRVCTKDADCEGGGCDLINPVTPLVSYGVFLEDESTGYTMFADLDNDQNCGCRNLINAERLVNGIKSFPAGVKINSLRLGSQPASEAVRILFSPYSSNVALRPLVSGNEALLADIQLIDASINKTEDVSVIRKSGEILDKIKW